MSTHTPGPWIIHRASEYTMDSEDDEKIMSIIAENGQMILFTDSGYFKPLEGNARLIAAAPELLEALKACVEALEFIPCRARNEARVVITKAEGRG